MKLDGDRVLMVDVDDTLVMWNVSEYRAKDDPNYKFVQLDSGAITVLENKKNINTLIKFKKLGYTVVVWSQSGKDWAEKVVNALDINQYVDLIMTKPSYYLDDLDASAWMHRLWRDAK